ncbi:hypothetical protein Afil01_20870 [Actinorhabdospora filicis]|uniref:Uncharacterized protein n=1 Tax=Actinorhabdospora filicis TaxID=1785913 RepID=A0A9W6SJV8_9ACTN|nr:hypothetical protein [Actinorhabdospora filicis]GLZ77280.1 hypothetical protein Afil01_20870 [Actinorhabdospora filicis]
MVDDFLDANPWCVHVLLVGALIIGLAGIVWPEKYVRDRDWSTDAELAERTARSRWSCVALTIVALAVELILIANGGW